MKTSIFKVTLALSGMLAFVNVSLQDSLATNSAAESVHGFSYMMVDIIPPIIPTIPPHKGNLALKVSPNWYEEIES